mgnify:CR=1 FL=1
MESLHQVLHDRQPEPGSTRAPRARLVSPKETLKDSFLVSGRDPAARVLNFEDSFFATREYLYCDRAALRRVLDGIAKQQFSYGTN